MTTIMYSKHFKKLSTWGETRGYRVHFVIYWPCSVMWRCHDVNTQTGKYISKHSCEIQWVHRRPKLQLWDDHLAQWQSWRNGPFYNSQPNIGHATAHTWERGWGWLVLNPRERFWWNSYVDRKIVRFLRKMDGPSWNLDKADFSPKRKESSVPLLVVQIHFMAPMVCLRTFTTSSLCTEACIFAKYLSYLLSTWIVLSSI